MPVAPNDDADEEHETDADRFDGDRTDASGGSGRDRFGDRSLLVVGAGPVGRWIAGVLDAGDTAFCDVDPDVSHAAAAAVGGRVVDIDSAERFDLVGVAVPISAVEHAIATHAPNAREAVFDVTGTMREPTTAMATHAPQVERVSLHPLFAPERAPGRVAMVTESESNGDEGEDGTGIDADRTDDHQRGDTDGAFGDVGPTTAAVVAALRAAGNEVFETTPTEHDRAMETVQARAHAAVLAYSLAAEPVDERFHTPVSEALTDVATRVTDGEARTYAEIQAAFDGSDAVVAMAQRVADAGSEEFRRLYCEARARNEARSAGEEE